MLISNTILFALVNPTHFTDKSTLSTGSIVLWNWGLTINSTIQNPTHTFPTSGAFPVNLEVKSDSGCTHDTTLMVIVNSKPIAAFSYSPNPIYLSNPTICFLNTSTNSISNFWNFGFTGLGSTSSTISPCPIIFPNQKEDTYPIKLIVINQFGCIDSVTINVVLLNGNVLYIPNTITPNGDNLNDAFLPIMTGVEQYELTIFNRWGEKIFTTSDQKTGWDGKHEELIAQQGVYIYKIRIKNKSGEVSEINGHINLIR